MFGLWLRQEGLGKDEIAGDTSRICRPGPDGEICCSYQVRRRHVRAGSLLPFSAFNVDPVDRPPSNMSHQAFGYLGLPERFFEKQENERRNFVRRIAHPQPRTDKPREVKREIYRHGSTAFASALIEIVEYEPEASIRRIAIRALARMTGPAGHRGLIIALNDNDREARVLAIKAIRRHRVREALLELIQLLDTGKSRVAVSRALVAIADPRAIAPMRAAIRRGWPWTRAQIWLLERRLATATRI